MTLLGISLAPFERLAEDARVEYKGRHYQLGTPEDERALLDLLEPVYGLPSKPEHPLEDIFMARAVALAERSRVEPDLHVALAALQRLEASGRIKVALAALALAERGALPEPGAPAEEGDPIHWAVVEEQLKSIEAAYAAIGSPGAFVREHVLRPLRDRFNAGERSRELATSILEVE